MRRIEVLVLVLGVGGVQAGIVIMSISKFRRRRREFAILLLNIRRVATLSSSVEVVLGRRGKAHKPAFVSLRSTRMCPQDPLLNRSESTLHPRRLIPRQGKIIQSAIRSERLVVIVFLRMVPAIVEHLHRLKNVLHAVVEARVSNRGKRTMSMGLRWIDSAVMASVMDGSCITIHPRRNDPEIIVRKGGGKTRVELLR